MLIIPSVNTLNVNWRIFMINKKIILSLLILGVSISCWNSYRISETESARKALSTSAIRFHVLANSDTQADQNLKMKVKENVVNYIYEKTDDFKSVEETKDFIISHDEEIRNVAQTTIVSEGFDYKVTSAFGKQSFPDKTYGDVTFPKGTYTSYTLSIGTGKGHNWWCVLYPPLCFVDASTGIVPDSSKERLQESLTDTEYNSIVKYRFKYLTFLNKYLD